MVQHLALQLAAASVLVAAAPGALAQTPPPATPTTKIWTETSVDLRPSSNDEGGERRLCEIRGECLKGRKWPVALCLVD